MFTPSPREIRCFFADAWRAHRNGAPLSGLQRLAAGLIAEHPEYHGLLEDPGLPADAGHAEAHNPFLHLSLHLALLEQLSVDHPPGIVAEYRRLSHRYANRHEAEHAIMSCLAEVVHNATQARQPPDNRAYLACLAEL